MFLTYDFLHMSSSGCCLLRSYQSYSYSGKIRSKMKIFTLSGIKRKVSKIYENINEKCLEQFSFTIEDVSYEKVIDYLHSPKDSSSLAVTRILFGIAMLFDIPDERGGAVLTTRWGDPNVCHFPLLPFVTAIPMPYMALVYSALWLGALGITIGYRYALSSWVFTVCYWYLFLIEKSFWNNHSYLFGLVALLLACTRANCYWSIDAYLDPSQKRTTVPYWNYFILKYQFFILYFMAGMKKGTAEWLTGYSVQNLSEHWVFSPFRLFLTVTQIDYLIVHWFIFIFDLTIAFWMMWSKTRDIAMVFCALFHLMNSRLFRIGMFPWVCLATMPLFYPFDWPKRISEARPFTSLKSNFCKHYKQLKLKLKDNVYKETNKDEKASNDFVSKESDKSYTEKVTKSNLNKELKRRDEPSHENCEVLKENQEVLENSNIMQMRTALLILMFVISQAFLPYSHFITKGFNNWTNGLYGYSWDMMVHTWDVSSVVVKVVDNDKLTEYFLDPYLFTPNDRWTRHGDMIYQYAHCMKDTMFAKQKTSRNSLSENISIYIDVWCSLNGRFTQRMFDSKMDLLTVSWSPFEPVPYLMPLLDEGLNWRSDLHDIKQDVHSWNNYSDVIFMADFPGYAQEKFIPNELVNVSLTVLKGTVLYETEETNDAEQSHQLTEGTSVNLDSDKFHKITNIDSKPAFYMYTFANMSEENNMAKQPIQILPITEELSRRFRNMITFAKNILSSIYQLTECQ